MFQVETFVCQEDWMEDAACKRLGTQREVSEIYFTEDEAVELQAKQFCFDHCPVRLHCLRYAYRKRIEIGIFGGLQDQERRSLLKRVGRSGLEELFVGLETEKVMA